MELNGISVSSRLRGFLLAAALVLAPWLSAWAGLIVTVKPIHICNDSGTGCGDSAETLFEAAGDKIWAQAGIDLVFLPWAQINETDYLNISIGNAAVIDPEARAVMTAGTAINNTGVT